MGNRKSPLSKHHKQDTVTGKTQYSNQRTSQPCSGHPFRHQGRKAAYRLWHLSSACFFTNLITPLLHSAGYCPRINLQKPKAPITASCSYWHLSLSFLPPLCALAMRDSQLPLSPSGTGPPQYLCPPLFSLPGILSPRALQAHASILLRSIEPLYSLLQKLTLPQSLALTLLSFPSRTDGTGFVLRCFADEHTLVCMLPFSTSEEAGLCTAYKRYLINTCQIQINL